MAAHAREMPDRGADIVIECEEPVLPPPPPPQWRLRVRVVYHQDQGTTAAGAIASVDGHAGAPVGGDGFSDFGLLDEGPHAVSVARSGADPPPFVPRTAYADVDLMADTDLVVVVDQVVRIRLGYPTALPGVTTVDRMWFRFHLPRIVGSGGAGFGHVMELWVDTDAGQVVFHGTSPYAAGNNHAGWEPLSAAAEGWRYCQIRGPVAATVTPYLREQGFSRDGQAFNAAPFVPWSFYFWSACRLMPQAVNTPVAFLPSAHVDNASGRSPFETFDAHFGLGGASFAWESDPAHDTHNDSGLGHACPSWVGHCNMMGAASVIFETPVNQVPFDFEELKLFAAEYAGNHSQSTNVWTLADFEPVDMNHPARPLRSVVPSAHAAMGGEAAWRADRKRQVREALGEPAARFLLALRQHLGNNGEPLLCDMRAAHNPSNVRGSSDEVWNQAVFFYEAAYAEHPDAPAAHGGEVRQSQDLWVHVTIAANADGVLPTDAAPGTIAAGRVTPSGTAWQRECTLRLQFVNGGDPAVADALNTWQKCAVGAAQYYIPAYLANITAVSRVAAAGDGNPFVTYARAREMGLQFRARYTP